MIDLTMDEEDTSASLTQISTDMERHDAECYITSLSAHPEKHPTSDTSHTGQSQYTGRSMPMLNQHSLKLATAAEDVHMKPVMVIPVASPGGGVIHKQINVDIVPPPSDDMDGMKRGQEFPEWFFWQQVPSIQLE